MMPYILNILHNSGTPQDVLRIREKLREFNITSEPSEQEIEQALECALSMGLVRQNGTNNSYTLAHKWFLPETQSFQRELHEVAANMAETLAERNESQDVAASSSHQPEDCMGPGMAQKRSPAQIRAIAIYRRMREQREREEREARSRQRRNSRTRSRSRSRTRRAASSGRTRSRSNRRSTSRSRTRSAARNRSASRSRRR